MPGYLPGQLLATLDRSLVRGARANAAAAVRVVEQGAADRRAAARAVLGTDAPVVLARIAQARRS